MDKQKEREKPQAKKHGPNQWRMNYKGMFGQAKTPELAYLRLVEVLHQKLEMTERLSSETDDYFTSEIKALKTSLKECTEKHQLDLIQNKDKYDKLLNDFRSQGAALEKVRSAKIVDQNWRDENFHLHEQILILKGEIKEMKNSKSQR